MTISLFFKQNVVSQLCLIKMVLYKFLHNSMWHQDNLEIDKYFPTVQVFWPRSLSSPRKIFLSIYRNIMESLRYVFFWIIYSLQRIKLTNWSLYGYLFFFKQNIVNQLYLIRIILYKHVKSKLLSYKWLSLLFFKRNVVNRLYWMKIVLYKFFDDNNYHIKIFLLY